MLHFIELDVATGIYPLGTAIAYPYPLDKILHAKIPIPIDVQRAGPARHDNGPARPNGGRADKARRALWVVTPWASCLVSRILNSF